MGKKTQTKKCEVRLKITRNIDNNFEDNVFFKILAVRNKTFNSQKFKGRLIYKQTGNL